MNIKFFKPTSGKQSQAKFQVEGFETLYSADSFKELVRILKLDDKTAHEYARKAYNKAKGTYFFLAVKPRTATSYAEYVFACTDDFQTVTVEWKESNVKKNVTFVTEQRVDKSHIFTINTAKSVEFVKTENVQTPDVEVALEDMSQEDLIAMVKNLKAANKAQAEEIAHLNKTVETKDTEIERLQKLADKHFACSKEKGAIIARLENFAPEVVAETAKNVRAERRYFVKSGGKRVYIANKNAIALPAHVDTIEADLDAMEAQLSVTEE